MLPASSFGVALSGLSDAAVSSERNAAEASVLQVRTALFWSSSESHGRQRLMAAATTGTASTAAGHERRSGEPGAPAGRGNSPADKPSSAKAAAPRAGNSQNQSMVPCTTQYAKAAIPAAAAAAPSPRRRRVARSPAQSAAPTPTTSSAAPTRPFSLIARSSTLCG